MSKPNLSVGTKIRADKINAKWRQSALMVATEIGQLLLDAKAELPHGDFERMIRQELDFGPQTARKLMAVASDKRIANRAPGRVPDHWTTYYELTKLDDDQLDEAFSTGVIHPQMRRSDVPRKRKESAQGDAVQAKGEGETVPPLADAIAAPPQTDAKGEDSAVDFWHGDDSDIAEKVAAETGDDVRYEDAQDASLRFATLLTAAMAITRELYPRDVVAGYPKSMLPPTDELRNFTNWMLSFEDEIANEALQSHTAA